MKLYRFTIDDWTKDSTDPTLEYNCCFAVVLAEGEAQARALLTEYRWTKVAKVAEVPLEAGVLAVYG